MRAAQSVKYNEGLEKGLEEGERIGIEKGEKIGIEKGEKIGIEKGKAEERAKAHAEKMETAKKMLQDGMPLELVAKYSGLSIDELN